MSLLQFRAQPQGFAEGLAHPPFGPLSTPRCPGQLNELPRRALLLDLRQYLAAPFVGELAGNMWLHVTHLLSAELMDGSARREDPHLAQAVRPAVPLLMIKIRYGSPVDRNDRVAGQDGYLGRCRQHPPVIAAGGWTHPGQAAT